MDAISMWTKKLTHEDRRILLSQQYLADYAGISREKVQYVIRLPSMLHSSVCQMGTTAARQRTEPIMQWKTKVFRSLMRRYSRKEDNIVASIITWDEPEAVMETRQQDFLPLFEVKESFVDWLILNLRVEKQSQMQI